MAKDKLSKTSKERQKRDGRKKYIYSKQIKMSKDRYKWRLAVPVSFYEDIRDCEKEAQVLQLTRVREKQGESKDPRETMQATS